MCCDKLLQWCRGGEKKEEEEEEEVVKMGMEKVEVKVVEEEEEG